MKQRARLITQTAALAASLAAAFTCSAADPFTISGTTTDLPVTPFSFGDKSLPDLVEGIIRGEGSYSTLANRTFNANLDYLGVRQALNFAVTQFGAVEWRAELTTPFKLGVVDRTFIAATREELYAQIEDYLKTSGTADLARWQKALSGLMPFGLMTGNPNSATALMARDSFNEYGLMATATAAENEGEEEDTGTVGLALMGDVSTSSAEGHKAQSYSATPFLPLKLSKRVRLDIGLPLNYTTVDGAQAFRAGLQLGMPILVVKRNMAADQPWLWQVTPSGSFQVAGSFDMVGGGALASGGLTSFLCYDFGKFEVSMGNQVSFFESVAMDLGDYGFDPDVSNQIVKNGLKVGVRLGQHWFAEVYGLDTELLGNDNFYSRYATFGGGFGYRANTKKKAYMMVGAYTDVASGWSSAGGRFGTGWKF